MALTGTIRVPSDKSLSHRAVLFAGLADGVSHLENVLPSTDVYASIRAIEALGAHANLEERKHGLAGTIEGIGLTPRVSGPVTLDCGNSGTTTRLLLGVLSALGVDATLTGDASLSSRPMERVMRPLREMGAQFECEGGTLPVRVVPGQQLSSATLVTEQASAQVKSAILLAGMQVEGTTSITEPSKSRDHTELLLPAFGVDVHINDLTASVTGPVHMHAHDISIPADPSSAAFIAVAAALIEGSQVTLEQVALNPTRIGAFEVLKRMGANIQYKNQKFEGAEPVGDVVVTYSPELAGVRVAPDEIPSLIDEIPILAIAAARAKGETVFEQAGELRVKESDRMGAIIEGLDVFGAKAYSDDDDLHIMGADSQVTAIPDISFDMSGVVSMGDGLMLSTYGDHRMAMTWYLATKVFGHDVRLDDVSCVEVSWPSFYEDVSSLLD